MKFKIKNIYIFVLLASFLVSCLEQTNLQAGKTTQDIQETQINITFSAKPESVITKYVNETQINNINIFVFGNTGNLLSKKYVTASNSTISTSTGNKTIVAIANVGQADFSGISTLNSLTNSLCTNYKDGSSNMFMVGYITQNLQKGDNVNIELSRIAAKISIAFDKSLMGSGGALADRNSVRITKIELKNVPSICKYLVNNTINATSDIMNGDFLESVVDLSATDGQFHDLYMLENMQGYLGSANLEKDKNPGSKSNVCSYAELTAIYNSPLRIGTVKYKFYLGNNITNNFDVARNTNYLITVRFTSDGGINENSWRVETNNLSDVLYDITADSSPASGGSISGAGGYKYGQIPNLIAVCAANYSFNGWSPALAPVTGNKHYTALFEYNSPEIHVTSINMTSTVAVDEGEYVTLNPTIEPSNATNKTVVWSSSDLNVATVDSYGNVTAHSNGIATVTATCQDGGYIATCLVTVYKIIDLYFNINRVIKKSSKDIDEMRDDIYLNASGGSGESIYFTYCITGPWDDSGAGQVVSGSFNTQVTSGISIKIDGVSIVSSNEGIAYATVSASGLTPILTNSPPYRFRFNQSLNTYTNQYLYSSYN